MNTLLIKNAIFSDKSKKDVYIEDGHITKIVSRISRKAKNEIDCSGKKAILPGLINCHTHSAMSFLQGYADDLPLKEWLEKKIWPLEAKMTEKDIYWATKLACLKMIKTGTTCFNDMYWFPEMSIKAIREMGLRVVVGFVLMDNKKEEGSVRNIEKNWQLFQKQKFRNITFSIAPHSIYTVSRKNLIWAKDFAQENKLLIHIHLSETEQEVRDCLKKHKLRPVEYLDSIGFLNKNCLLAHTVWLSAQEIKILEKRKCNVIYNPCSNMKLGSGIFPYPALNQAGVNICLGTDGSASNNSLDLWEEMKFASLLQKINQRDSRILPVKKVFELATKNAAKALNIRAGEVKEGKIADFILIDLKNINLIPNHNLLSNLIYAGQGNWVSDVICNGKVLMRNHRIKGENEIIEQTQTRIKKLFNKNKGRNKRKN